MSFLFFLRELVMDVINVVKIEGIWFVVKKELGVEVDRYEAFDLKDAVEVALEMAESGNSALETIMVGR